MDEDKYLKDLLTDYQPKLTDDAAFMQRLHRQMALIDEVKAYQREEKRKNKRFSIIMLAIGILLGSIVTIASFTLPDLTESLKQGSNSEFIIVLLNNIKYISLAIGSTFIMLSLLLTSKLADLNN
ncbi:PTS cellobiose transporter subunit IIC [Prevotella sp.]|mgnify:FL=1|uniref:PTS cellobiose transporter subunit IIC n=1 Tax=Prevotella sp. TaxID=59823 RepID=UPI001CB4EDFE|nr:PTS cellobiose transporter subunit IIC [Prevotella sp.]MBF1627888.1 PTS cellobiose transporter subunit IIC [Prevotella sp.]